MLRERGCGKNYRQWLPYFRIEEAKRFMLAHPDYSLQSVAEAHGLDHAGVITLPIYL